MTDRPPSVPGPIHAGGRAFDASAAPLRVGRDEGAPIRVDGPGVSREHGVVEVADGRWRYRDTSRNGSFVDGRQVDGVALLGRVVVRLGAADGPELVVEAAPRVEPEVEPVPDAAPAPPAGAIRGRATSPGQPSAIHEWRALVVRIGRSADNDIVLEDFRVSRHHAELRRAGGATAELADLDSQNGTFLNGARIERAVVADGDFVGIGNTTFRFVGGRLEQFVDPGAAWLAAQDLRVVLPSGRALVDGVSFALEPSSLLAIIGPSGAGKTTLLQALTGAQPADWGRVLWGGRDLYASYADLRGRMGIVPQSDILHPQLTVRQALLYAAELRFPADVDARARRARVDEVLEELGLRERAELRIDRLSGGQRKRTSVAVELLTRPSLLFLDEPTSGLDPAIEATLMDQLRDLAHAGRTVIVVTHSIQTLDRADRVLLLAPGGRMAYFGPPSRIEGYFGQRAIGPGVDRVFRALVDEPATDWPGVFAADPSHAAYVARPLADAAPPGPSKPLGEAPAVPPTPWPRQLAVLVRRYLAIIRADRGVLALLILQAPIFGVLFLLLFRGNVMSTLFAIEAGVLVWLLALGATWLGTSNSIREIVKELPIYRRERAIGLSTSAYLASKMLVLGTITVLQTVVLVLIAMTPQQLPPQASDGLDAYLSVARASGVEVADVSFDDRGAFLDDIRAELVVGIALTGVASMAVGLLVSAAAKTTDRAATILPLLLISQTVVSAPLLGRPPSGLRELGYLSTTQWGFAALAATVDLNDLRSPFMTIQDLAREQAGVGSYVPGRGEREAWRHDPNTWLIDVGAILALAAAATIGTWLVLRRMDPSRSRRKAGQAVRPVPVAANAPPGT